MTLSAILFIYLIQTNNDLNATFIAKKKDCFFCFLLNFDDPIRKMIYDNLIVA